MIKISEMPAAASLAGPEQVPIVQSANNFRTTISAIGTYVLAFISASGGSALIGFIQAGTGAVARLLQDKVRESVSVFDYMTSAQIADVRARTALIDVTAAINAAITYVNSLGGGTVRFPAGTYATSTGLTVGNGSNSAVSTIGSKIRLVGEGYGSSTAVINQQVVGASTLLYTGTTSASTGVLTLAGPLYGIEIENLCLDAAAKAGRGIIVNHVTAGRLSRVSVRNPTTIGFDLTTRTGFPTGCAFGCADNRFYDCYSWIDDVSLAAATVRGISLNSGVSTGTPLVGLPDSARNVFIGGTFMYGTTATSYGVWLSGADNNNFIETQFYPYGGATSGFDIYLQQWASSATFPLENVWSNPGMTIGMSGNGGVGSTGGNTINPMSTSDGAPLPTITGVSVTSHLGQMTIQGVRAYRVRQPMVATLNNSTQSNSTTSAADVPGLSVTLTTLTAAKLRVSFSGRAGKATGGTGFFTLALNTSAQGDTKTDVAADGTFHAVSAVGLYDVGAGSQVVTVQFTSSDTNAVQINCGTLIVEELD